MAAWPAAVRRVPDDPAGRHHGHLQLPRIEGAAARRGGHGVDVELRVLPLGVAGPVGEQAQHHRAGRACPARLDGCLRLGGGRRTRRWARGGGGAAARCWRGAACGRGGIGRRRGRIARCETGAEARAGRRQAGNRGTQGRGRHQAVVARLALGAAAGGAPGDDTEQPQAECQGDRPTAPVGIGWALVLFFVTVLIPIHTESMQGTAPALAQTRRADAMMGGNVIVVYRTAARLVHPQRP
jgi:hypothetical protein